MKIYEMDPSFDDQWVYFTTVEGPISPNYSETKAFFDSQPRIRIDRDKEPRPRKSSAVLADFTSIGPGSEACFGARAKAVLGPRIDALGQWLPLECDEAPYWLFNVTHTVDALDESESQLIRFDDGSVLRIAQFTFHPEKLRDALLFNVPQSPGRPNLVTQDFVDIVHEHGLTGFSFRLLWSEENGPVSSKLKDWERPRFTGLEPRTA